MGKGSNRRPSTVSDDAIAAAWERIYGKPIRKALAKDTKAGTDSEPTVCDVLGSRKDNTSD